MTSPSSHESRNLTPTPVPLLAGIVFKGAANGYFGTFRTPILTPGAAVAHRIPLHFHCNVRRAEDFRRPDLRSAHFQHSRPRRTAPALEAFLCSGCHRRARPLPLHRRHTGGACREPASCRLGYRRQCVWVRNNPADRRGSLRRPRAWPIGSPGKKSKDY
jgi:hypothetical protein